MHLHPSQIGFWMAAGALLLLDCADGLAAGETDPDCAASPPCLEKPAIEADWLQQHRLRSATAGEDLDPDAVRDVLKRGFALGDHLREQGVNVESAARRLQDVAAALAASGSSNSAEDYWAWYLRARWAIRELAFANPLLDFDDLVFVQRSPGSYAHMSDQYYGWFSRPGGGVWVLEDFRTSQPRLRCLTSELPTGSYLRPDLSWDGRRVLFAYCRHEPELAARPNKLDKSGLPEEAFYHLFEVGIDGSGLRRLTAGKYDDFDGRYLPDGRIVFVSTRRGQFIQCPPAATDETRPDHFVGWNSSRSGGLNSTLPELPDSYMRCGGSLERPVPTCTLHVMDGDGAQLRAISPSEGFDWNPSVANDGRILYSRWDYVDRDSYPFISLWSTLPDGSAAQAVFGNYTANPMAMFEPRSIPNSSRLLFTAAAQHSITGGSLVLLDPRWGADVPEALTRLTPEVVWPESEGWPSSYYLTPYPLSERFFLVAWSNQRLFAEHEHFAGLDNPPNAAGLYLGDAWGNLELIYRDPRLSSLDPLPVRSRTRAPLAAPLSRPATRNEGRLLLLDVYRGLDGVPAGSIRGLRIVGLTPKTQPVPNFPQIGLTEEDAGKFVLGTVPVEADGSAYFRVPASLPFFLQALDEDGLAVQTMRSAAYVQAGQTYTCSGCHEPRTTTPVNRPPRAAARAPSRPRPGPEGTWPLDFDQLVQPVLDRLCVHCHQPGGEGSESDLRAGYAYSTLVSVGDRGTLQGNVLKQYAAGRSTIGAVGARGSALARLFRRAHYDVQWGDGDWERLVTWMDLSAQRSGSFSKEQADRLRELRREWSFLLSPRTATEGSE